MLIDIGFSLSILQKYYYYEECKPLWGRDSGTSDLRLNGQCLKLKKKIAL